MAKTMKITKSRSATGSAIYEFTGALVLFICFFFVPIVDMAFVPARYMLVQAYLEKVAHHMAVSDKRSLALQYLNDGSWRGVVEKLGVTIKSANASLIVCDNSGATNLTLPGMTPVPQDWLPGSSKLKGETPVYNLELAVTLDIPPLFSGKSGLPGFNSPITLTMRNRAQWENLSPDPLTTADQKNIEYYINE